MQDNPLIVVCVFVAVIVLVMVRPRGWPEAIWSCAGAALLLSLRAGGAGDVRAVLAVAGPTVAFLLALLLLAALVEESGFFEWAAIVAARRARGDAHALYRNVYILGALVTVVLSLDTTAVMLTPLVLALVRRARLPARPFVLACVFVANIASLVLPISNLTNLLVLDALHLSFVGFALRLALPQLAALVVGYWALRRQVALPARFSVEELGDRGPVIGDRRYFRAVLVVLPLVCVGYFAGPRVGVPLYAVALAGCALLLVAGVTTRALHLHLLWRVNWAIVPFVVGLLLIVQAVEKVGLTAAAATLAHALPRSPWGLGVVTLVCAVAANLINNVPTALLARSAIIGAHLSPTVGLAALLGTNLGCNLLVFGSLATLLAIERARTQGNDAPTAFDVLKTGVRVTPWVLVAALVVLVATVR